MVDAEAAKRFFRKANPLRLSEMRRLAPPSGEDVTEVLEYVPGSFRIRQGQGMVLSDFNARDLDKRPANDAR